MTKYLNTIGEEVLSIAACPRCKLKIKYVDLVQDPNNLQWYCRDCVDEFDPYRLPVREGDKLSLQYPRPDEDLVNPDGTFIPEALL